MFQTTNQYKQLRLFFDLGLGLNYSHYSATTFESTLWIGKGLTIMNCAETPPSLKGLVQANRVA